MNILVTGASGFIGRHVVSILLARGHSITAISRERKSNELIGLTSNINFIECDLYDNLDPVLSVVAEHDALIHLAWRGLPNYEQLFHLTENLFSEQVFLSRVIEAGIPHIIVAGTCLEYGLMYGPLAESVLTNPIVAYGIAKDVLRKSISILSNQRKDFVFQWLRLFYTYGQGQNPRSILPQLDLAIENGERQFVISSGDQLRDYLPVERIAENFALALENPAFRGVLNCSSGVPISIYDLVMKRCIEKGSNIEIIRGEIQSPSHEPHAFWGIPSQLFMSMDDKAT